MFNNSKPQTDAYGNVVLSVVDGSDNINLDIEVERDTDADKKFHIKDTPTSSAYFSIRVDGLPDTADRGVLLEPKSIQRGVVSVEQVSFNQSTGVTRFLVTGRNGGAPVGIVFRAKSGGQTITVNVAVNLTAKDVKTGPNAHFGVRQLGAALDFNQASTLSKFNFYAHPDDDERNFKPNHFPMQYRLKENYQGVALVNGQLTVNDQFVFDVEDVGQIIYVQGKLQNMLDDEWIDIPVYVFRPATQLQVASDAFQSEANRGTFTYDLIANRSDRLSARFSFSLADAGQIGTDYDIRVVSNDITMVEVTDTKVKGERTLSALNNLGTATVMITAYPSAEMVIDGTKKTVWFHDAADANVWINEPIYIRVRNEFISQTEISSDWHLNFGKNEVNAFYYEGYQNQYYDYFTLDTDNHQPINFSPENYVEFELVVEDVKGTTVIYNKDTNLYEIIDLRVFNNNEWTSITKLDYQANYRSQFSVAMVNTTIAETILSRDIKSIKLRAKSVLKLSTGTYGVWDVPLMVTSAIDDFDISGLIALDNEEMGLALVHDQAHDRGAEFTIRGLINDPNMYSKNWNPNKVTDNRQALAGLSITDEKQLTGDDIYTTYRIAINDASKLEYYIAYPFTLTYPNGVTRTINIKIYPTVSNMSMNVVSGRDGSNGGRVYQTYKDVHNSEYIKTVYVLRGYEYYLNVETPGASVGAAAQLTETVNGEEITTLIFDARNRAEGCYSLKAHLTAYSNDVFINKPFTDFEINFVVVNPVGDVIPSTATLTIDGFNRPMNVTLATLPLSGEVQDTNDPYLVIEQVLTDSHLRVKRSEDDDHCFEITGMYLTDEPVTIGFRVYKHYDFGVDLNGDGNNSNDAFDIQYTTGALVTMSVNVVCTQPVSGISANIDNNVVVKEPIKHVELVSSEPAEARQIDITVSGDAKNREIGYGFVKLFEGQSDINNLIDLSDPDIKKILANVNIDGNVLTLQPVLNADSIQNYALVVYAADSLRLVTMVDGKQNAIPDVYELIPLFIGSRDAIDSAVESLTKGEPHDRNSGVMNKLGGYNWVLANPFGVSQDTMYAVLFYTTDEGITYNSDIDANRYYIDDLSALLPTWTSLKRDSIQAPVRQVYDEKNRRWLVDPDYNATGDIAGCYNSADGRMYLQINDYSYSARSKNREVRYQVGDMYFYVVKGIKQFNVTINDLGAGTSNGLVARKTLAPDGTDASEHVDTAYVLRGESFQLFPNVVVTDGQNNSGWTADTVEHTASPDYEGGIYSLMPYITLHTGNTSNNSAQEIVFTLDALTATVPVEIVGGISSLTMAQTSNTIDGAGAAVYDATVVVDRAWNWEERLLNYNFVYGGVYYPLFTNINSKDITTYVSMEGGNAGFLFKISCTQGANKGKYYTYYLRIEVSVIIASGNVNPFYNVSGAYILLQENLAGSPLLGKKTACEVSAELNLFKQGISNVSLAHFANTSTDSAGNMTVPANQSNTNVIYLDSNVGGGVLTIYPTPYYIGVTNLTLEMAENGEHEEKVVIGTDLRGDPIEEKVRYYIGFTQLVYNRDLGVYQPYLSGNSKQPAMISSWSNQNGYQWEGKYYFRTYIRYDGRAANRLQDGAKFVIKVSLKGEDNAKAITETMTLYARYREGIVVTPGDGDLAAQPVCTMVQTNYLALGTTGTYDVSFPTGYTASYSDYTIHGDKEWADITVDPIAKTLRVRLLADTAAIGKKIEIRFPYRATGDFVNPYLSVVIIPVYYEFRGLEIVNHLESPVVLLKQEDALDLQVRAVNNANLSFAQNVIKARIDDFNGELRNSALVKRSKENAGQLVIRISYSYVNGRPSLMANGDFTYEQTFLYEVVDTKSTPVRTEYLAIGTTKTFALDFDVTHKNNLSIGTQTDDLWDADVNTKGEVTVSLKNNTSLIGKTLTINIMSMYSQTPDLILNIVPVYFTFSGFKLQNYPVSPLIALSDPFAVHLEVDQIEAAESASEQIKSFNQTLANAQFDWEQSQLLAFKPMPNANGIINFDFDNETCEIKRNDLDNPITATSYLQVVANIAYQNGMPCLDAHGNQLSTIFTVKTYGDEPDDGNDQNLWLEPAENSHYRKVAQAIGTTQTYNIALTGVAYDTTLDLYEMQGNDTTVWTSYDKNGWSAVLNGNQIMVTLKPTEDLYRIQRTLVVLVYSQEDRKEAVFELNIIPALFSVDSFLLADHQIENPVILVNGRDTIENLVLDFIYQPSDPEQQIPGLDYAAQINKFRQSLRESIFVERYADGTFLTLTMALNYVQGIPEIVARSGNNADAVTVRNSYRYKWSDTGSTTKVQVIGTDVTYNVLPEGRVVGWLRYYDDEREKYVDFPSNGLNWYASNVPGRSREVMVHLDNTTALFNHTLRIGVFADTSTEKPEYVLSIVPAYFAVNQIGVVGQNGTDIQIVNDSATLEAGKLDKLIHALQFEKIIENQDNTREILNKIDNFHRLYLQNNDYADYIYRKYANTTSGDLMVTIYLKYVNGEPTLVDADQDWDICLDTQFRYTVVAPSEYEPDYDELPNGPRTRDEVQAIGTTVRYIIDLPNQAFTRRLESDDKHDLGWSAKWDGSDLIVTIDPDVTMLGKTITINLNSVIDPSEKVFVLNIKPVLYKITGFEIASIDDEGAFTYRVVAEYDPNISRVIAGVDSLNTINGSLNSHILNSQNGDTRFVKFAADQPADGYQTITAAIAYSDRGIASFCLVDGYPLNVVESVIDYANYSNETSHHFQAIGTTKRYYLDCVNSDTGYSLSNDPIRATIHVTEIKKDAYGYYIDVTVDELDSMYSVPAEIKILYKNDLVYTLKIQSVYFTVDGVEVMYHPERHMWLLAARDEHGVLQVERVSSLSYRAKATYSANIQREEINARLHAALDKFNQSLLAHSDYLSKMTVGGKYLVVRIAVVYQDGEPQLVDINGVDVIPNYIKHSVFEYKIYRSDSAQIIGDGVFYPTEPRSRTVAQAIGVNKKYTIDVPSLPSFGLGNLELKEQTLDADQNEVVTSWRSAAENGWSVSVTDNNQIQVQLTDNATLRNRLLLIYVYYSADNLNPAFILKIKPVWFTVEGFALADHPESPIVVDDIKTFVDRYVPVLEYSSSLDGVQEKISAFIKDFNSSEFVSRTSFAAADGKTFYYRVTTSVDYSDHYDGEVQLGESQLGRMWQMFEITQKPDETPLAIKETYQGIGSTKTYYVDVDLTPGAYQDPNGRWSAVVSRIYMLQNDIYGNGVSDPYHNVQVTVTLSANLPVGIDSVVDVNLDNKFILRITPVWFEVLDFEIVEHPERGAWIFAPANVGDLQYRAVTNDMPNAIRTNIQEQLDEFNRNLNAQRGKLVSETISYNNKYIVVDAALEYYNENGEFDGIPHIVRMTEDLTNVVETVFNYIVWSDSKEPVPTHPNVMGRAQINQIIGNTNLYTLGNINGKIYYQYIWLEGAGSLTQAISNNSLRYEGAQLTFDAIKETMSLTLTANERYLDSPIYVYIPYLVTINGKDVWYSYCLEVTPVLFEVVDWTVSFENYENVIQNGNYINLSNLQDKYQLTYHAKVKKTIAAGLQDVANAAISELEKQINQNPALINAQYISDTMILNGKTLTLVLNAARNPNPDCVELVGHLEYINGLPNLITNDGTLVATRLYIYIDSSNWPPESSDNGIWNGVQAIGTTTKYVVPLQEDGDPEVYEYTIMDGDKVTELHQVSEKVKFVDYENVKATFADGENPDDLEGEVDLIKVAFDENVMTVQLAPVLALRNHQVIIRIPYTKTTTELTTDPDSNNESVTKEETLQYYYEYQIQPVLYVVQGYTLSGYNNNYLNEDPTTGNWNGKDVPLVLRINAVYDDSAALRTQINLSIQDLERQINQLINNGDLQWDIYEGNNLAWNNPNQNNIAIKLVQLNNQTYIRKFNNITSENHLMAGIRLYYNHGIPSLDGGINQIITNAMITIDTQKVDVPFFSGDWKNLQMGENSLSQNLQAIGTSKSYQVASTDPNQVLYYQYAEVFYKGVKAAKRTATQYEYFDLDWDTNSGTNLVNFTFTLKANARVLTDWVEVRIPYYVTTKDDQLQETPDWYYYVVKIKPVLFEIKDFALKVNDEIVDEVTINDSAVELYFTVVIRSAPLDIRTFRVDELVYIERAIEKLEAQLNEFDATISDYFKYMIIHNVPQENFEVNYQIYRDESEQKNYLIRDIAEASRTAMQLSATVSYEVTDVDTEFADGAQAVVGYQEEWISGATVTSTIYVNTTDQTTLDESIVVITQDNAGLLASLSPNTNYILMSDISLSQIDYDSEKVNRGWKPVNFPENSTLDGNNFKIYLDGAGFDLSDQPNNIGLFSTVPAGSVLKNVQLVLPRATSANGVATVEVNLSDYAQSNINIGLLVGVNQGIITNCAVLSHWQFFRRDLVTVVNPTIIPSVTNPYGYFTSDLPFNRDGYLFDDKYFYWVETVDGVEQVTEVYNSAGHLIAKDKDNNWVEVYDEYKNNLKWIVPDRTNVACYDYSAMIVPNPITDPSTGYAPARLFVSNTNQEQNVVMGGLVGINNYMITNSRVLADVELDGPQFVDNELDRISIGSAIVGGVVGTNSNGATITSTFFRDGNIINNANVDALKADAICYLGGFVGYNQGRVTQSYAMGKSSGRQYVLNFTSTAGSVKTNRNSLGGFVHQNSGEIKDCMANLVIQKGGPRGKAGGFVYRNVTGGTITNCIANNLVRDTYADERNLPFIVMNATMSSEYDERIITTGLSNLIYAGINPGSSRFLDNGTTRVGILKNLSTQGTDNFWNINNFNGYSIGISFDDDNFKRSDYPYNWDGVSAQNTIWQMTPNGIALRTANDIAVSYRKTTWVSSPYLYAPGTEHNPYLVWDQSQFRKYIYAATAQATTSDSEDGLSQTVDDNRQGNHLRLVDNVTLGEGIKDTYKITYTGTFEGNALTMDGLGLSTTASDVGTLGLFGRTENATFRNTNFVLSSMINSSTRYVGGIAGIAINTNFVDINMSAKSSSASIVGVNIVGGIAGVAVVTNLNVENYNISSTVSVTASYNNAEYDADTVFDSGLDYYRQTLLANVTFSDGDNHKQGYSVAGGVFGFITSNPNNYKIIAENGETEIIAREFETSHATTDYINNEYVTKYETAKDYNQDAKMFLPGSTRNKVADTDKYYDIKNLGGQIVLRNVNSIKSGSVSTPNISGNVAGGLIGIMDETFKMKDATISGTHTLTGKYYLGGMVGINLGEINGGNVAMTSLDVVSVLGGSRYVYRGNSAITDPKHVWGMTIGGVAAYNDGFADNEYSGLIQNVVVQTNVLETNVSQYIYVIGGVVGVNGERGNIQNTINTSLGNSLVLFDSFQSNRVGYYSGKIVGRANVRVGSDSTTNNFDTSIMDLIAVSIPNTRVDSKHFNFNIGDADYPVWINSFGIKVDDVVNKVQTMTMTEYKTYLMDEALKDSSSLVSRVEALETWFRSLPTYYATIVINGETVPVEMVESEYLNDYNDGFLSWIQDNNIFVRGLSSAYLLYQTDGVTVNGSIPFNNYQEYVKYAAIGEPNQTETEFRANIAKYREQRYQKAIQFFTYQDALSQGTAGTQNAHFTWADYERYLIVRQQASQDYSATLDDNPNPLQYTSSYQKDLNDKYGDAELAKWTAPYQIEVEEIEETHKIDDGNGGTKTTTTRNLITISNNKDLGELLSEYDTSKQFTEADPLQGFINFVGANQYSSATFSMELPQYYYFFQHVNGNLYGDKANENGLTGKYTLQQYADYLSTNSMLSQSASRRLTLDEYMLMILSERATVLENEARWLKTGHLSDGVQISTIGALELKWVNQKTDWTQEKIQTVQEQNGVFWFLNGIDLQNVTEDVPHWEAFTLYTIAKQQQQLTISTYSEIVRLGGSLYELRLTKSGKLCTQVNLNPNDPDPLKYADVNLYLLHLKTRQFGWTTSQEQFIGETYGLENLIYAVAATYYGEVNNYDVANARVVDPTLEPAIQNFTTGTDGKTMVWWYDENKDGQFTGTEKDRVGIYQLLTANLLENNFINGDGETYKLYNDIDLRETKDPVTGEIIEGAALYIDVDGDKMYTYNSASPVNDILVIYEVDQGDDYDFESSGENKTYYKIARRIVETNRVTTTIGQNEYSDNLSDYLEESLWWYKQGFTAKEFDQIKTHAMTKSIPQDSQVVVVMDNKNNKKVVETRNNAGFTIADDWFCAVNGTGLYKENFTTADYTNIVLGAHWDKMVNQNGTTQDVWYSTFGDYLLFKSLLNAESLAIQNIDINALVSALPNTSILNDPFKSLNIKVSDFLKELVPERVLSDAMEFANEKTAFLKMFNASISTADYILWAKSYGNRPVLNVQNNDEFNKPYNFRLNHYIYWVTHDYGQLNSDTNDYRQAIQDFSWALTQDQVRSEIYYKTVTQESRTTDLMAYRQDWWNNGQPYITFRDYCEWINTYYYNDSYKADRGDLSDEAATDSTGTTQGETAETGWLTLDAFAVWKRMEKYENNVEYLNTADAGSTSSELPITAPILKRQISTTILPKVLSSGNPSTNESGLVTNKTPVLPSHFTDTYADKWYGWAEHKYITDSNGVQMLVDGWVDMPQQRQRHFLDRYEYNEKYVIRELERRVINANNSKDLIPTDNKYTVACDCSDPDACIIPSHNAYQFNQWEQRYGTFTIGFKGFGYYKFLILDEDTSTEYKENENETAGTTSVTQNYAQLYIPFEYFRTAAKQIKSYYSPNDGYQGYHNFMHFWARNGDFNWIGDTQEYTGPKIGIAELKYIWSSTGFWNRFDGTVDPFGNAITNGQMEVTTVDGVKKYYDLVWTPLAAA